MMREIHNPVLFGSHGVKRQQGDERENSPQWKHLVVLFRTFGFCFTLKPAFLLIETIVTTVKRPATVRASEYSHRQIQTTIDP